MSKLRYVELNKAMYEVIKSVYQDVEKHLGCPCVIVEDDREKPHGTVFTDKGDYEIVEE